MFFSTFIPRLLGVIDEPTVPRIQPKYLLTQFLALSLVYAWSVYSVFTPLSWVLCAPPWFLILSLIIRKKYDLLESVVHETLYLRELIYNFVLPFSWNIILFHLFTTPLIFRNIVRKAHIREIAAIQAACVGSVPMRTELVGIARLFYGWSVIIFMIFYFWNDDVTSSQ